MKKKLIYIIILILVVSLSFGGGYFFAKSPTNKENISNKEDILSNETSNDLVQTNTQETSSKENQQNLSITTNKDSQKSSKNSKQSKQEVSKTNSTDDKKSAEKLVYIDVYYQDGCGYCTDLFSFLNNLDENIKSKIVLTKHNVYANYQQFIDVVKKFDGDKKPGTPYVIFNNQKTISGFSKEQESKYLKYINEFSN